MDRRQRRRKWDEMSRGDERLNNYNVHAQQPAGDTNYHTDQPPVPQEVYDEAAPPPPPPPDEDDFHPPPPPEGSGQPPSGYAMSDHMPSIPPGFGDNFQVPEGYQGMAQTDSAHARVKQEEVVRPDAEGNANDSATPPPPLPSGHTEQGQHVNAPQTDANTQQQWDANVSWGQQQYPGYDMYGNYIGQQDSSYAQNFGYQHSESQAPPGFQYPPGFQDMGAHQPHGFAGQTFGQGPPGFAPPQQEAQQSYQQQPFQNSHQPSQFQNTQQGGQYSNQQSTEYPQQNNQALGFQPSNQGPQPLQMEGSAQNPALPPSHQGHQPQGYGDPNQFQGHPQLHHQQPQIPQSYEPPRQIYQAQQPGMQSANYQAPPPHPDYQTHAPAYPHVPDHNLQAQQSYQNLSESYQPAPLPPHEGGFEQPAPYPQPELHPWTAPQQPAPQQQVWGLSTQYTQVRNEIDAELIFCPPGRYSRPAKIAIIMRGLPGSGKTHIVKRIRELETEHGSENPRIHAIDDYFMTEVEKEELVEVPGKKPKKQTVTVLEYVYEEDLEETYKQSMLKAFSKTVEESRFPLVIIDASNIQVEDFKPAYMAAKRCGYEVYVVKPLETDAQVCYKRNVHNHDEDTINDLAALYEPTPNLFTQILVESLFDLPRKPKEETVKQELDDVFDPPEPEVKTDQDHSEAAPKIQSRWASAEDDAAEPGEEAPKKKKRKKEKKDKDKKKEKDKDKDDSTKEEHKKSKRASTPEKPVHVSQHRLASKYGLTPILKYNSAPTDKSVCWADEAVALEGFSLGGPANQLEEIHVLEGLGPDPEHQQTPADASSFDELAAKERMSEGRSFRDILLGRGS